MTTPRRPNRARPAVHPLEGRQLLSQGPGPSRGLPAEFAVGRIVAPDAGRFAVLAALRGGAGSEFVTLVRRQVPNLRGVIAGFVAGNRTAFSTAGLAVQVPSFLPGYDGPRLDQLTATAAGAVRLRGGTIELAAILRGPIDDPTPSTYVFALDRGSGAVVPFADRPSIRHDALVTITRSGSSFSGNVQLAGSDVVTPLTPDRIRIEGPTLRVFVDPALLPSAGQPVTRYRFAFWTQDERGAVASRVPDAVSIPIGNLGGPIRR